MRFWSHGGSTDPDNLILLCSTHHRSLHRGEFSITAHGAQKFTFHAVDGTLLEPAPALPTVGGWEPNLAIAGNATVPVNGGRLSLAYTVEVLYRTWDGRTQRKTAA